MTRRLPHLLILSLLLFSSALQAAPAQALARLQTAVNEVLAVADRSKSAAAFAQSARPVLERHISFETMTRRAVGPGWRSFTPAQQQQATQLFTTLIIRTYTSKFTPGEHPAITYQNAVSPASGRVDVPTNMVYRGSRYNVTYRMEEEAGLRITDVTIEGVSLIANYRSQLDAQFKKGGAAAVISSLTQSVSRQR